MSTLNTESTVVHAVYASMCNSCATNSLAGWRPLENFQHFWICSKSSLIHIRLELCALQWPSCAVRFKRQNDVLIIRLRLLPTHSAAVLRIPGWHEPREPLCHQPSLIAGAQLVACNRLHPRCSAYSRDFYYSNQWNIFVKNDAHPRQDNAAIRMIICNCWYVQIERPISD